MIVVRRRLPRRRIPPGASLTDGWGFLDQTRDDLGRTPFVRIRRSGVRRVSERRRRGSDASNLNVLSYAKAIFRLSFQNARDL
jgi:hypothetical protein